MWNRSTVRRSVVALSFVFAIGAATSSAQQPFLHADGTTHWYDVVTLGPGADWTEALHQAHALGGYLATITSTEEAEFVFALIDDPALWTQSSASAPLIGPWIGAVQSASGPEPAGGWRWASAEPFAFTVWAPGQPDNGGGIEDRVHYIGTNTTRRGAWADAASTSTAPVAFVIEYSGTTVPQTAGLTTPTHPLTQPGYTLFHPRSGTDHFLIDERGRVVNRWTRPTSPAPLASPYLMPNGDLLTTNVIEDARYPRAQTVERYDWSGKLIWEYQSSRSNEIMHHDIEPMPNGNVLINVYEIIEAEDAVAAGRHPGHITQGQVWSEKIIEVQPTYPQGGTIVWEWRVWDHLVQDFDPTKANYGSVAQHPERVDVNYDTTGGIADWLHFNSIKYNAALDQIVMSSRTNNELWIIDHSTTTAEARGSTGGRWGKGGDLLYRWGNPEAYRAGTPADRTLFFQHKPHWIPAGYPGAGNILVFNNGPRGPHASQQYSTVDEIVPPTDAQGNYVMSGGRWGPAAPVWSYRAPTPTDFYSRIISGAQRLPNGNTLICSGFPSGILFEVTPSGETVWRYGSPCDGSAGAPAMQGGEAAFAWFFRATRYPPTYAGFANRDLTPGGPVERYDAAMLIEGARMPHRAGVGTSVGLTAIASGHRGRPIQFAAALGQDPFQIDYRFVNLTRDAILAATIMGSLPTIFRDFAGTIDAQGESHATIALPSAPALVGLVAHAAFAVLDPAQPSGIALLSNSVTLTIDP